MRWVNEKNLSELLALVADSPLSSFFAEKYRAAGLTPEDVTVENFDKLPFLTRQELEGTPISKRTYAPLKDIRSAAFTSGTTSGRPIVTLYTAAERYHFEPSFGFPVSRMLVICPPVNKTFTMLLAQLCRQAEHPVTPVFGDFQNFANSAFLAKELECDCMMATPTTAALFAEEARKLHIENQFKLLTLAAEPLSEQRRGELARAYPNAGVASFYASTELEGPALFPCKRMIEEGRHEFHVITEDLAAVELIEDELIVSRGLNRACPLVRYQTRDYFRHVAEGCPCGRSGPVLAWSHRKDVDRVRINGVEFQVEDAEAAFASIPHVPRLDFQVHFRPVPEGVAIDVEVADAAAANDALARSLSERIEGALPDVWRISGTATLGDALKKGLFHSLQVRVVPALSIQRLKARRLVNHVS